MKHSFLGTFRIWLSLGAREPFLIGVAVLAMLLSWGWVLSDVDLFNLIWHDNAGDGFDKKGNRFTESSWRINWGALVAGGMAASIFWHVWVSTAYVRLRKDREKISGQIKKSRYYYYSSLIWLSIPGILSFIPAIYSNGPRYDECDSTLEERWPFLLGAVIGAILFYMAYLFSPRSNKTNSLLHEFFKSFPVTTIIFGILIGSDIIWRHSNSPHSVPSQINESPVPVAFVWWLLGIVLCTFEVIGRAENTAPIARWHHIRRSFALGFGILWIVLIIARWIEFYRAASVKIQDKLEIWRFEELLILFGFLVTSFLLTWIVQRKARTPEWKNTVRRRVQFAAAIFVCASVLDVVLGIHRPILYLPDPITGGTWWFSAKAVLFTSITLFVLSITLANWIDSNPFITTKKLADGTQGQAGYYQIVSARGGMQGLRIKVYLH